jgi:hypothetical protein
MAVLLCVWLSQRVGAEGDDSALLAKALGPALNASAAQAAMADQKEE